MIKGGQGLIRGAGKIKIPDAPARLTPIEIAGTVRKLSGDVNSPLPLILLDTSQSLMSDKSVIVTPITRERVEGIQRIVDPVNIFTIENFFKFSIAMDWTSGTPILDINNKLPSDIFGDYKTAAIYSIYASVSQGERIYFELNDELGARILPPTIIGGDPTESNSRSLFISSVNMPLCVLSKTSPSQIIYTHDGNGADNYLTLWGKLFP